MTALRLVRTLAWVLVTLAAALAGWLVVDHWARQDLGRAGLFEPVAGIGGPFALTTTAGARFTEADLQGRPTALFFGFTFCPEVCPTTLLEAGGWLQKLGPKADKLRVVFVTVDPERDTVAQLASYLSSFDKRIVGLTGTPEDVAAMLKAYKVFARKVPTGEGDYTMDHTASVYLLDSAGRLVGTVSYREPEGQALRKVESLVARG